MVRKAKNPPSMAKMYRHFAVVTVLVTAAVALMADGNSQRAVEQAVDDHQKEMALQAANDEKFGPGRLIDNSKSRGIEGDFGDDSWVGGYNQGFASSTSSQTATNQQPPWLRLGMSREDYEALSEQKRRELLASLDAQQPDQATMNRIAARSLERSGRSEPSADAP